MLGKNSETIVEPTLAAATCIASALVLAIEPLVSLLFRLLK